MKTVFIGATIALLLTTQTAAAGERYSCGAAGKRPTVIDIDPGAKQFLMTEGGKIDLDRTTVCDAFRKIVGALGNGQNPTCSLAFSQNSAAADYVGQNFVTSMVFSRQAMTLSAYGRIGDSAVFADTVPCKRL